jgi:hypothetical protein
MRFSLLVMATGAGLTALAGAMVPTADAQSRRGPYGSNEGYVTAESRYGPQTITGRARVSAQGRREVQLPGGNWIECRRSCSNTLREETIDFWAIRDRGPGGFTDGPGYLHFRW